MLDKRKSIKIQMFLRYTGIFVVTFALFALLVIVNFSVTLRKTEEKNMDRELELIINSLDVLLSDCTEYLNVISTDKELVKLVDAFAADPDMGSGERVQLRGKINAVLSNIVAPNTKLIGASVVYDDMVLCASYSLDEACVKEIVNEEYAAQTGNAIKPVWGNLTSLSFKYQPAANVFPISKAIINKDTGEKKGIVTVYLQETDLAGIYEKSNYQKNRYYIIDAEGHIISSLDKSELYDFYEEESDLDWCRSRTYEARGWQIVCIADQTIFNQTKAKMAADILLILLLLAAGVFALSYVSSVEITRPLYSLLNVMKEIEDGDASARSGYSKDNEFGILSREFNRLIDGQQDAMQQIYQHQKSKRKNELLLLQSQIKPHFLYNTMETISSFVRLDQKENALLTIQSLSGFYRKTLSMGKEIIRVKEEISIIEEYLKIQSLRYKCYMEYTIDIEERILNYEIPKLILQPLVENSIYHGIKQKDEIGELIVRGYEQDDKLYFEVFDTGNGMTEEKKKEIEGKLKTNAKTSRNGFGLFNVAERLRLFYGDACDMQVDSEYQEYTQITIIIPKKELNGHAENIAGG